jgi:DNA polymerase-4
MQKPDGLTIIAESDIEGTLWPLSVRKLWGVGPKTEAHLRGMGIETIGNLAATPLGTLVETFGNSYGKFLYESSRGMDESPLVTHWEPKSSSRETTFQRDTDNWQVIARNLAELTKEVVNDLKRSGYKGKNVTVKVRFSDFKTVTRTKTLQETTDSLEEIRRAAFDCFGRIELTKKVRLIGVRAGKLERVSDGVTE